MNDQKQLAGAGGTVKLGDRLLYVEPLPHRQEQALLDDLRKLAKVQGTDFLKPMEPMLERLMSEAKNRPHVAGWMQIAIETAARMTANGDLPGSDAAEVARRSPEGVALELWYRTRRTHPSITQPELAACITAVNAADVHWQIREALGGGEPGESKSE